MQTTFQIVVRPKNGCLTPTIAHPAGFLEPAAAQPLTTLSPLRHRSVGNPSGLKAGQITVRQGQRCRPAQLVPTNIDAL